MISYELYKVIHLAAIFLFLTGSTILLVGSARSKLWSALTGVASLFILVSGMGLVHRSGVGFAPWVIGLLVIWLLISGIGHMVAKRCPSKGMLAIWLTYILAVIAVFLATYKP